MKILTKLVRKIKTKRDTKLKREISALRRMGRAWLLILALGWGAGYATGCACVVGAARGAYEGGRRDVAAARDVLAPGTPALPGGHIETQRGGVQ